MAKKSIEKLSYLRDSVYGKPSTPADWTNANGSSILEFIQTVSKAGGAVRFGFTRDGGTYAVGVYFEGDRATFYCRPQDDIDDFMRGLLAKLEEVFRG